MRVAVTGSTGRLGRALVAALEEAPFTGPLGPIAWTRADIDLDDPRPDRVLERDRPEVVVHAAAWTDVDGCAREPDLAMRRNGEATRVLAEALAGRGLDLVVISTNEVFDGRPHFGELRGYRPADAPGPINPYGRSKLAAERHAQAAFDGAAGTLGIVRTAWLFGPPGNDFPTKILAAADRARSVGQPLRVVGDEAGSPTYAADLAEGIVELLGENAIAGIHHVVNSGVASRADWAAEVLRQAGISVDLEVVSAADWARTSEPPRWGVLEPSPLPSGEPLRTWQGALADYMPVLTRARASAR